MNRAYALGDTQQEAIARATHPWTWFSADDHGCLGQPTLNFEVLISATPTAFQHSMSLRDHFLFPHSPAATLCAAAQSCPRKPASNRSQARGRKAPLLAPMQPARLHPRIDPSLRPLTTSPNRSCSPPEQEKRRNPRSTQLGRARRRARESAGGTSIGGDGDGGSRTAAGRLRGVEGRKRR
jgi:hypothetical protein